METWQINISLIPSIAVILTSSNRMALGLTDEINQWFFPNKDIVSEILAQKIKQLKRLSIAIFLMYLSLSILVINALLVGLDLIPHSIDKLGILISIIFFLVAIYFKILFSFKAYFIRQKQFKNI
ncbi:MAG: hypothetical protein GQ552_07025 [Flavobacteriaceae bacterium]|nr:hypothetical protein [Flavobacteriaceae bacterium]